MKHQLNYWMLHAVKSYLLKCCPGHLGASQEEFLECLKHSKTNETLQRFCSNVQVPVLFVRKCSDEKLGEPLYSITLDTSDLSESPSATTPYSIGFVKTMHAGVLDANRPMSEQLFFCQMT
eukprot:67650_1